MNHEFPRRLRRLRERRRMNRKEPSIRALVEIADFFAVSADYLLGREKFF